MNAEFFEALSMLEKERGISGEYLLDKIKSAIVIAVKKDYMVEDENVQVDIDPASGRFNVCLVKDVVEDVENPHTQLSLEDARQLRGTYSLGDKAVIPLKTKEFGRIAAQTAKHVIRQGIREAERSQMYADLQSKAHELVTATVLRVDDKRRRGVLRGPARQGVYLQCGQRRAGSPHPHQPHQSRYGQAHV